MRLFKHFLVVSVALLASSSLHVVSAGGKGKKPKPPAKKPVAAAAPNPTATAWVPPKIDIKPPVKGEAYNYGQVLHLSYLFYEAQRSGKLPANKRVAWRGDSGLDDGKDQGLDLTGGWYDAGDHVKFGLPMAWSTTVLNWGLIEYWDAYDKAGELHNALDGVKWPLDWLIKAHPDPDTFYCQVGEGNADHNYWGPPEAMTMERPSYKTNGAEPPAEAAAALASGYLVFKDTDATYAAKLLTHAKQLYELAVAEKASFNIHEPFYKSWSGYEDELAWSAAWLYAATGEAKYLEDAKTKYETCCKWTGGGAFSWDSKASGVQLLLYKLTGDVSYADGFDLYMGSWLSLRTTPKGLAFFSQWGPNRYAANTAFLALLATDLGLKQEYRSWGLKQIHYLLGDCCGGLDPKTQQPLFSYVVGYGNNYPKAAHHRGSSCSTTPSTSSKTPPVITCDCSRTAHPNVLLGALVGGPDDTDTFSDDCSDYVHNEVATDYNAGFTSAVAAIKHLALIGQLRITMEEEQDQLTLLPAAHVVSMVVEEEEQEEEQQQREEEEQQQPLLLLKDKDEREALSVIDNSTSTVATTTAQQEEQEKEEEPVMVMTTTTTTTTTAKAPTTTMMRGSNLRR